MRSTVAAGLGLAVIGMLGAGGALSPACAQDCQELWIERNSYYKRAGYCFRTQRAITFFGNGGCHINDMGQVPLSPDERARIQQIVALERSLGCPN